MRCNVVAILYGVPLTCTRMLNIFFFFFMYTDSGSNEMWCVAILMAQHTDVRAAVRQPSLILSHSGSTASPSEVVLGVF